MPAILDNLNCNTFFEGDRRNTVASVVAGALFFIGWWVILDAAAANYTATGDFSNAYYAIGVFSTISFFMINSVTNSQMRDEGLYDGGCCGPRNVRLWLFIGIVMGFSCAIASCWVLIQYYLIHNNSSADKKAWPGFALVIQNLSILIASYVYKFGRSEELWN